MMLMLEEEDDDTAVPYLECAAMWRAIVATIELRNIDVDGRSILEPMIGIEQVVGSG